MVFLGRMIGMILIKRIVGKSISIVVAVLLTVLIIVANLGYAIGDLGIVVEKMEGAGEVKQCRYCGRFMKIGNIPRDADTILGNLLREGLTARNVGYRKDKNDGNYINLLVYRYEERIGGNYGVEKPAGAGFHIHLMENNVFKRVFIFDEDQQALSENLFNMGKFFRRGARWLTVEELSRDAINQGLDVILEEHR
jgi:hypothetical protein